MTELNIVRSNMDTLLYEYDLKVESIDTYESDLGIAYIITTDLPTCMFTVYDLSDTKFQVELYDENNHIRIFGKPDVSIMNSFEDVVKKYKLSMFDKTRLYNKFCKQI